MAFANPVFNTGPDLPQRLTQLLVDPKRTCNISRQMTFGLKALYQRIKVSMMTRDSLFSDDNEYVIRQKIAQGPPQAACGIPLTVYVGWHVSTPRLLSYGAALPTDACKPWYHREAQSSRD